MPRPSLPFLLCTCTGLESLSYSSNRTASDEGRKIIVYTTLRSPNQDIYLVDGPDGKPRRMTDHRGLDYNATFPPDGENVYRISSGPGVETTPDTSPDGTWLALATDRDGAERKICHQRIDGSQGRFLEPDRRGVTGIDNHPRFSPDGAWIAFVSDPGGWADELLLSYNPQPYGDLWAVPIEGGIPARLSDDKWEDDLAQWGIH